MHYGFCTPPPSTKDSRNKPASSSSFSHTDNNNNGHHSAFSPLLFPLPFISSSSYVHPGLNLCTSKWLLSTFQINKTHSTLFLGEFIIGFFSGLLLCIIIHIFFLSNRWFNLVFNFYWVINHGLFNIYFMHLNNRSAVSFFLYSTVVFFMLNFLAMPE